MNKRIFFFVVLILNFAIACKQHKEEAKEEAGKFTITSPILLDTSYAKEYIAQIQSIQNVEIHAQEKGYLESILVDEGQFVHAGQLLFKIMPKLYEAELAKSRAELQTKELELQNVKTLAEKNIISKTELAIAEAKLNEAKADVMMDELHVSFTDVRAPFDGIIDRIKYKKGSLIDENMILTSISNNRDVFAYFNVTEIEYLDYKTRARNGEKNTVTLQLANGQLHKHKGTIETVESEFDNTTGNIAFRARFPNPEGLLKHGETGKVLLSVPLKNALIIPQKATYELQDLTYVYLVDKENKLHSKRVDVLQKLPNIYVINPVTLNISDKILLDGIQSAKEDDIIESTFRDPKEVITNLQLIK